jgi:signal transduction histidine kinase
MGLAICTKIIQYHGGHIWVDSDGNHGSIFQFALPADGHARESGACVQHSTAHG